MAHINRKEYWTIFIWLTVLTALEVGIVYVPGIPVWGMVSALVMLALVKAGLVGWFFMHLNHESRGLKLTVAIPMAAPALYAFVLIAEGMWRFLH